MKILTKFRVDPSRVSLHGGNQLNGKYVNFTERMKEKWTREKTRRDETAASSGISRK